jgi:hypothetical protein
MPMVQLKCKYKGWGLGARKSKSAGNPPALLLVIGL